MLNAPGDVDDEFGVSIGLNTDDMADAVVSLCGCWGVPNALPRPRMSDMLRASSVFW